ncbi:MAG: Sporulation domain protein, partial [Caulobacteraceae bacterium]|nr:Sporulation domain protein [Caulobacteraceae bacterium]
AATAAAAPAVSGPVSAQVGAFSSSALADRGWADAVRLAPGAAVGKGKAIEEAQVNGRTVYRALVTGFENRAGAVAFCASVSAAGGNCLVR